METVYECALCSKGVEYNTEDMQEHNEFEVCTQCFDTQDLTVLL